MKLQSPLYPCRKSFITAKCSSGMLSYERRPTSPTFGHTYCSLSYSYSVQTASKISPATTSRETDSSSAPSHLVRVRVRVRVRVGVRVGVRVRVRVRGWG